MNTRRTIYQLTLMCLGGLPFSTHCFAQYDPTFSQYMFNEIFINPAYTGSNDALALSGAYRWQWIGIDGAPITETFTAHVPTLNKKMGIGIGLLNESIGQLRRTGVYANYAYRIKMKNSVLAFGLQAGIQRMQEFLSRVSTTTENDSQFMNDSPRYITPNFGFGMYYSSSKGYVGVSIPRLVQTDLNSVRATNKINPKDFSYFITGGYTYKVSENLKLIPSAMLKLVNAAPFQYDLSISALLNNVLWIGGSYISQNAVSGMAGFQINPQLKASYSYDYTLSSLRKFNSGSHEFRLTYIFSFTKEKIVTPRLF